MKKRIRLAVDIAMTVLLPMLMAYSLIGETFHEVIGTTIFVLFIFHHVLNRKWYASVFKGKYNIQRVFRTVLNILLIVIMVLQPVSGFLMSKHLYTSFPTEGIASKTRIIHLMIAYWGFVLMSVHLGTHLHGLFNRIKISKPARTAVWSLAGGISIYGCYAFVKRGVVTYMFLRSAFVFFDYSEPRTWFFADYISMMVLFGMAGYLMTMTSTTRE